ncbi:hypothetical protein AB2L28_09660 [Kineococcus sp. TBRC 1896]|uniref:Preprotein translocase subunit TatA n=1 Tax=Kineococcus mangrovi TaxID=1660183 RepID=A0ABV4I1F5_9ACTN
MDQLAALLPPAGLALLFVLLMRAILHADRRERAAARRVEAERPGSGPRPGSVPGGVPGEGAAESGRDDRPA